ncbi:MAG TPA: S8 family peptidase [Solirubrobacteraceae bacterium]
MLQGSGTGRTALVLGLLAAIVAAILPAGAAADDRAVGVLVRYRPGTTAAERADTRHDAAVARQAGLPLPRLELDKPAAAVTVDQAVADLNTDPDVLYAEPNRVVHAMLAANDNLFADEWGLNNTGQSVTSAAATPVPVAGADIDAEAAWDLTTGDASVVVGVVDTGVDATHPDLAPNIWTNTREIPGNGVDDDGNGFVDDVHGWDFVGNDNAPADVTAPGGNPGHGTHVSGTIAARGNDGPGFNSGVAGVTWSSTIMPVRVLDENGSGTLADVVAGYAYAARNGARIINASLGDFNPSQTERATIASFPNTLFVVAAGNDGANTDSGDATTCGSLANPPASCSFPCDYGLANIVCVAASDRADELATFSNFGTRFVDLAAPGVTIWSTAPGGWRSLSGTSMATPHVAGVAALALARDPSLTTAQLRQALIQGVDKKASLTGKVASGGRLNALGALTAADAIARPPAPPAPTAPPPAPPAPPPPPAASRPTAQPATAAPSAPSISPRAPDHVAPELVLSLPASARMRAAVRRGLHVAARADEACTLSFRLLLDSRTARRLHVRRTLALDTSTAQAGAARTLELRVPRALTRVRTARLTLRVRATDAAGNVATRAVTIMLRR